MVVPKQPHVVLFPQGIERGQASLTKGLHLVVCTGSLLVFRDDIYKTHYHGIEERTEDVLDGRVINIDAHEARRGTTLPRDQTRVSLTIRIVKKVLHCSS